MRKFRGHHLFCMALFTGNGYNQSFTENMKRLIEELEENSQDIFFLTQTQDDICLSCPNLDREGICTFGEDDIRKRDTAALSVLGIRANERYSFSEIKGALKKVTEKEFRSVCEDCRWMLEGYCTFEQLEKRCMEKRVIRI